MYIGILIAVALGVAIIKYAVGFIFKLVGFIAIVVGVLLALYQFEVWPFEKNLATIGLLEKRYCLGTAEDQIKCDCIVKELKKDINSRFSREELKALDENRIKSAYVLKKSLDSKESDIKACLTEKEALPLLDEFKKELIAQESDILKKIGNWLEKGKEKVLESVTDIKESKEHIDAKYQ